MAEHQLPELGVAGSNPVARSISEKSSKIRQFCRVDNCQVVKSDKVEFGGLDWNTVVKWFIDYRKVMNCSPRTIEWYQYELRLFLRYHEKNNLTCTPETCNHVADYLASRNNISPITKHGAWRSLRTSFYFFMQQGIRADNPAVGIQIKLPETMPRTVTAEHLAKVLQHLDLDTSAGLRNAVLLLLAFDTGARLSELLSFTIGDVLVGQRKVLKGGKDRWVFFGRFTAQLLQ